MTAMFLRSIIPSVALAVVLAAPAQAAPVLTSPLAPCYIVAREDQRQPIPIAANGFTPFNDVGIYIDEILQFSTQVLREGNIAGQVLAPHQEVGTRPFTLRLSEAEKPENVIVLTTLVTRLAVEQSPTSASTGDPVRFKGRGFLKAAPVYAHYVYAGKVRKSVKLKTPTGPCGTFTVRRPQFPFKAPATGKWTIQFDQYPQYNPKADVRVPLTIRVKRTPKQASARAR